MIEESRFWEACRRDRIDLRQDFFASCDQSRLMSLLQARDENRREPPAQFVLMGEGADMEVWSTRGSRMNLAVRFWRTSQGRPINETPRLRGWLDAVRCLENQSIHLVPPFLALESAGSLALVTPFGESLEESDISRHWQPLEDHLLEFYRGLISANLWLSDSVQIASTKGIPFVHDLSDLRKK